MWKVRSSLVALAIGVAVLSPRSTSAQIILPQQQCAWNFLSACATLHFIDFSGSTMTLIVSNDTDGSIQPMNFIGTLLFDLSASAPDFDGNAFVEYGAMVGGSFVANGDDEEWKVTDPNGNVGGFQVDWDIRLDDNLANSKGGDNALSFDGGLAAMITINFVSSVEALALIDCGDCEDGGPWSAQIQGLGVDGNDSGFTTIPEPITVTLLGSGLLGLAGAGAMRRRRRDSGIESP